MHIKQSSLREYLQILRKRRNIVLTVFAGIMSIVSLGTFMTTPSFDGVAQIIIERVEPNNLSGSSRFQRREPEFDLTQFQLIRSHAVARRVVQILDLESSYENIQNPDGPSVLTRILGQVRSWVSVFSELFGENDKKAESENVDRADLIAKKLSRNVRVRPVQSSHITAISYSSPNPEFSALVANTYINAYLEETLEMKTAATRRNLEWMTQKAESERIKLKAIEKRAQDFMESHNLVTLEERVTILPEKLSQLGGDLVRAETRTKENKLLYDKLKRVSGNPDAAETVLSISEGSSLDVLRAQILRAEQNVMELSGKYGGKHPAMIKAEGDLNILKRKRMQEIQRLTQKVRDQYELALSNENSIRSQFKQTKAEAIDLNEEYVQYSALNGESATNRQLYDSLQMKIKEQSIIGETRPVNIWVVESASAPLKPVKPNVALNLTLGVVLGLLCGVAGAFLADQLDNRIKSSEGVGEALGVPVLGSISFNKDSGAMSQFVHTEPLSEYAESFNALRTTLMLASAESPPKRILVTSSIAGEGKTTTAINLALTMAKAEERVLLVDADLRKPSIHKIFKMRNRSGLSNYLTGTAGKSIVNKGPHENLFIIPSGPIPPNPYELLNSKRMASLLDNLSQEFDVIICDTAPSLSVSDSRLLSHLFDGLLMVTMAGKTTYPMAMACIKSLQDVNAKILGILVNAVRVTDQEDYYRYYSSYLEETVPNKSSLTPAASPERT